MDNYDSCCGYIILCVIIFGILTYFIGWIGALFCFIAFFGFFFYVDWMMKKKMKFCTMSLLYWLVVCILACTGIWAYGLYDNYQRAQKRLEWIKNGRPLDGSHNNSISSKSSKNIRTTDSHYHSIYDDGYETGYEDGIHRDHSANKESDDYEYEDGYFQGYYDAVHDDEDWEDDESEDW